MFGAIASASCRAIKAGLVVLPAIALSGCSTILSPGLDTQRLGRGEVPTPIGSPVRDNRTPMEGALACFGDQMTAKGGRPPIIAVGDVKDYTGKYSISEGNAITQGGSLMVYSALGKIGNSVGIAERFDPVIAERELIYTDKRQLGDGLVHDVSGNRVPWLPYFGGTIRKSDYYIIGGITELNYDIRSNGAQLAINNIGPKVRVFTASVGVDLRIVDSRTLVVIKTVSLTKQFTGYEIGANTFRFFGNTLFDINVGAKGQEPLQLGIRAALEEATMRLVASVAQLDPSICMSQRTDTVPDLPADQLRGRSLRMIAPTGEAGAYIGPVAGAPVGGQAAAPVEGGQSLNALTSSSGGNDNKQMELGFEFGDPALMSSGLATLGQIVSQLANSDVELTLMARDSETWDAAKRDGLTDQRIAAIVNQLAARGVPTSQISITWRPDKSDTSIHRGSPGMQEIAKLKIQMKR